MSDAGYGSPPLQEAFERRIRAELEVIRGLDPYRVKPVVGALGVSAVRNLRTLARYAGAIRSDARRPNKQRKLLSRRLIA